MEKPKGRLKRMGWTLGMGLLLFEVLLLFIILFDQSPKDWGSLLPVLILLPAIGVPLVWKGQSALKSPAPIIKPTMAQPIRTTKPSTTEGSLFHENDILCMAVVHEGHLPQGYVMNPREIALEIMTTAHALGSLTDINLSNETLINVQRANETAYYQGDYEPKDDLGPMISNLHQHLRSKMLAHGDQVDHLNVKNLMFKSHSHIAGTLWVQLTVLLRN